LPGASTLLVGSPGAGKTLSALHFIVAGAERSEPGLIVGFHEHPARLVATAAGVGLDLDRHLATGRVRILWRSPAELAVDAWTWEVLAAVAEHQPRRLVVDALTDVERHLQPPERLSDYVAALTARLRADGVTPLFVVELDTLVGPELRIPLPALSAALDNVLLLRQVELGSRLQRLISIIKVRQSAYDSALRAFTIDAAGVTVGAVFPAATPLLTGAATPLPPGTGAVAGSRRDVS
jgi:circadian clock protein KaiC